MDARHDRLRAPPVESDDADEGLLELLVGESVAERVDGAVEVADPVGDVVKGRRDGARQRAVLAREADDERQDVPRDPSPNWRKSPPAPRVRVAGGQCHGIQQTMKAPRMIVMVRRALRVRLLLRVSCCSRFLSVSHDVTRARTHARTQRTAP